MDPITRRTFLASAAGALFAACGKKTSAPSVADRIVLHWDEVSREEMLRQGALPENVRACLAAAVGAVINRAVDAGHYVSCFAWRSENLPGFLHEYTQFTRAADQVGAHLYATTFAAATKDQQRDVIQALTGDAHPEFNAPKRLRHSVRDYVVHETQLIFARTDGWLVLGYDGWPGTGRGLDTYTQAPARKA
jgi:hypothetical protein